MSADDTEAVMVSLANEILKDVRIAPSDAMDAAIIAFKFLSSRVETAREDAIEECAKVAESAPLTEGYQWGRDAMGSFNYGKKLAAKAIRSLSARSKTAGQP